MSKFTEKLENVYYIVKYEDFVHKNAVCHCGREISPYSSARFCSYCGALLT